MAADNDDILRQLREIRRQLERMNRRSDRILNGDHEYDDDDPEWDDFLFAHEELDDLADLDEWAMLLADHRELRGWIQPAGTVRLFDGTTHDYPAGYHYYTLRGESLEPYVIAALERADRPEGITNRELLAAMYGSPDEATTSGGRYQSEEAQHVPGLVWSLYRRGLVERTQKRQGTKPARWRIIR